MVSLFEVCPGKTGSQFPCPAARSDPRALYPSPFASRLSSAGESAESFSNEPPAFNAFSRGLLSVETAASGLEFTGNNTGDSPRRPENARHDKVSRRRDAFACLPLSVSLSSASLFPSPVLFFPFFLLFAATFKLPKPARSFREVCATSTSPPVSRPVASRRLNPRRSRHSRIDRRELLGTHGAFRLEFPAWIFSSRGISGGRNERLRFCF